MIPLWVFYTTVFVLYVLLFKFFLLHDICHGANTRIERILMFFTMPFFVVVLIASDGCVCSGCKTCLHLKEEDRYLVQKVANLMGYIGELPKSQFSVNDKELYLDLNHRGIHERKSRTIDHSAIPNIHLNAFVRGLFDGDGSICMAVSKDRNKQRVRWNITGHKPFLECVRDKVNTEIGVSLKICPQRSEIGTWSLYVSRIEDIYKLHEWLYKDADDLFMMRKKQRFDEYIDYLKNYQRSKKYLEYKNNRPVVNNKCKRCRVEFSHRADHPNQFCSRICSIRFHQEKRKECKHAT